MTPEARARLEGDLADFENDAAIAEAGGYGEMRIWKFDALAVRDALATIDAQAARVRELLEALTRQTENMAFVLNRVDLHGWHDKFDAELTQDRALIPAPDTKTGSAG